MSGDTRDAGRVWLCAVADQRVNDFLEQFDRNWLEAGQPGPIMTIALITEIKRLRSLAADLLAALELLLPYATIAPAWAVEAARDAIEQAKGQS